MACPPLKSNVDLCLEGSSAPHASLVQLSPSSIGPDVVGGFYPPSSIAVKGFTSLTSSVSLTISPNGLSEPPPDHWHSVGFCPVGGCPTSEGIEEGSSSKALPITLPGGALIILPVSFKSLIPVVTSGVFSGSKKKLVGRTSAADLCLEGSSASHAPPVQLSSSSTGVNVVAGIYPLTPLKVICTRASVTLAASPNGSPVLPPDLWPSVGLCPDQRGNMSDMSVVQILDDNNKMLIKVLSKQLKLPYPYLGLAHSSEINGTGVFKQAIMSFITIWLARCDVGAKHVVAKWLKINKISFPEPAQAMRNIQQDQIYGGLAARGMIDLVILDFYLNTDPPIQKDPSIYQPVLKLSFEPNLVGGSCSHTIEFISCSQASSSSTSSCGIYPGSIRKYQHAQAKPFKFLIYNAKGAANPDAVHEVDSNSVMNDVDHVIVTETRLSGLRAKAIRDSMNLNRSESVDSIGFFFCGILLLWCSNVVNFELLTKDGFGLSAAMKILDKPTSAESQVDF
ncbi:hypothetical protein COLO4_05422 [Corchorus olitorius]|uniref:Uncharacterized protein n=1 Tax=Corchorus olitorius TaxID=93759 RepID=A0A1R3KQY1_9ROSI|nr:hypothetical protein COLO4_05422 [Corchorus olitorius]